MFKTPSHDDILEGVIVSLQTDVLPNLTSQAAQVTVVMMQAMLQMVRQLVPVAQQNFAREHNEMTACLRDMAKILGASAGPEAERMRERAKALGSRADFPVPPAYEELANAHSELSQGLVDSVRDLDILIREGNTAAEGAMARMRAHLGPRIANDFGTLVVGAGMAGRG